MTTATGGIASIKSRFEAGNVQNEKPTDSPPPPKKISEIARTFTPPPPKPAPPPSKIADISKKFEAPGKKIGVNTAAVSKTYQAKPEPRLNALKKPTKWGTPPRKTINGYKPSAKPTTVSAVQHFNKPAQPPAAPTRKTSTLMKKFESPSSQSPVSKPSASSFKQNSSSPSNKGTVPIRRVADVAKVFAQPEQPKPKSEATVPINTNKSVSDIISKKFSVPSPEVEVKPKPAVKVRSNSTAGSNQTSKQQSTQGEPVILQAEDNNIPAVGREEEILQETGSSSEPTYSTEEQTEYNQYEPQPHRDEKGQHSYHHEEEPQAYTHEETISDQNNSTVYQHEETSAYQNEEAVFQNEEASYQNEEAAYRHEEHEEATYQSEEVPSYQNEESSAHGSEYQEDDPQSEPSYEPTDYEYGSNSSPEPDRLYSGGYTDPEEEELRQVEVYLKGLELEPSLEQLQNVENVIANTQYSQAIMTGSMEEIEEQIAAYKESCKVAIWRLSRGSIFIALAWQNVQEELTE